MALLRSLPENATLVDLRRADADLLEKLRPYGHQLMRGPSPLTCGQRELIAAYVSGVFNNMNRWSKVRGSWAMPSITA